MIFMQREVDYMSLFGFNLRRMLEEEKLKEEKISREKIEPHVEVANVLADNANVEGDSPKKRGRKPTQKA